jgi:hypothetical protein
MDVCVCIRVVVSRKKEKGEERVGVGGRGKYSGAPPHHIRKREEKQADRKVPDRPVGERGKAIVIDLLVTQILKMLLSYVISATSRSDGP